MIVQSLSIDVPCKSGKCVNKCPFCCSRMHNQKYEPIMLNLAKKAYADKQMRSRLEFTKDEGCNNIILTGEIDPMQNVEFLNDFAKINWSLPRPFRWIEIQTSGYKLNPETLIFLRDVVGVKTISLSVVNPFDSKLNMDVVGLSPKTTMDLFKLCVLIKQMGFTLRISLNLTNIIEHVSFDTLFAHLKDRLHADQVTFRKLYLSSRECDENEWIKKHKLSDDKFNNLLEYIFGYGRRLERLSFGAMKYAVHGMSTVVDSDCMSTADDKNELKYLILRPDCKLYSKWDEPASLVF